MNFDAVRPFVTPFVRHLPDVTIEHHVRQAAIAFCARTHIWKLELPVVLSQAGLGTVSLQLDVESVLVLLDAVFVGDEEYEVTKGEDARRASHRGSHGRMAYTERDVLKLMPAPSEAGKPIAVEVIAMPSIDCQELPDLLIDYTEQIAHGALASLMRLPGEDRDMQGSLLYQGLFDHHIAVVGIQSSRGHSSARARSGASNFF